MHPVRLRSVFHDKQAAMGEHFRNAELALFMLKGEFALSTET